jgi:predicted transcriptional regulator
MFREGYTYPKIAEEVGASLSTIKKWAKSWKVEDPLVQEVNKEVRRQVEQTVEVEKHHLDHLLEIREKYNTVAAVVEEKLAHGDDKGLLAYLREAREWLALSAKLEGVEPPTKNINLNASAEMSFDDLMKLLREKKREQDERL